MFKTQMCYWWLIVNCIFYYHPFFSICHFYTFSIFCVLLTLQFPLQLFSNLLFQWNGLLRCCASISFIRCPVHHCHWLGRDTWEEIRCFSYRGGYRSVTHNALHSWFFIIYFCFFILISSSFVLSFNDWLYCCIDISIFFLVFI